MTAMRVVRATGTASLAASAAAASDREMPLSTPKRAWPSRRGATRGSNAVRRTIV